MKRGNGCFCSEITDVHIYLTSSKSDLCSIILITDFIIVLNISIALTTYIT